MLNEVDRVKERRRERMERMRQQIRNNVSSSYSEWKEPLDEMHASSLFSSTEKKEQNLLPPQEKLRIQTFLSLALIGAAYLLFQSGLPLPDAWKVTAREVMTRDFNFAGAASWYEARFGSLPAILPAFATKKNAVPVITSAKEHPWQLPKDWKVEKAFETSSNSIVLNTGADQMVLNNAQMGWVSFVGEKPGYGLTVAVRFPKGWEIWFGNLEQALVEPNDVLYKGEEIGLAKATGLSSHQVILAMKEKETFVDPMRVIAFE